MSVLKASLTFISSVLIKLSEARGVCNVLAEFVMRERVAMKHGRLITERVMAKADQLRERAAKLAEKLQKFRMAELRFSQRVFTRG